MIPAAIIVLGAVCTVGGLGLVFHAMTADHQPPKVREPARKAFYDRLYDR